MIVPPSLKKGDKIRIVAPAGKIKKDIVLQGMEWLRSQGYSVEAGKHVLDEYYQFAGIDDDRLADLQEAFNDPETAAIICARGGYGTLRMVDRLDFKPLINNPKWLIGFSDITILHNILNQLGVASIHGPMLRHFPKPGNKISGSVKSLFSIIEGGSPVYITGKNNLNRPGCVTASLAGGNLSIIYSLASTPFALDTEGKILFIEDIGEHLYHTDRMMLSLKRSGKLQKLAGLLVGGFSGMKDNKTSFGMDVYEIIADAVKEYNYPVCFGFQAGHIKKNMALAFGMNWELKVAESGCSLKLLL